MKHISLQFYSHVLVSRLSYTKAPGLSDRLSPQGPSSYSLSRRVNAEGALGHPDGRVWDCRLRLKLCLQHGRLGGQPQLDSRKPKRCSREETSAFCINSPRAVPRTSASPRCRQWMCSVKLTCPPKQRCLPVPPWPRRSEGLRVRASGHSAVQVTMLSPFYQSTSAVFLTLFLCG